MNFTPKRHDIGFLRADGSTQEGLILARTNGVPDYKTIFDKYLVNQYTTSPDYGATNPEQELPIQQDDWRSGMGLTVYDYNDPYRYLESYGIDLRQKNQVSMSYKATAVTNPDPTTDTVEITNGTMEADSTWSGGARDGTHKRTGSYTWLLTVNNGSVTATNNVVIGWGAGGTYTVTVYGYMDVDGGSTASFKVGINDGVGETYGTAVSTQDAFTVATATRTLNAAATQFQVKLWFSTTGSAEPGCWFDDCTIAGVGGTLTLGVGLEGKEFNDELYEPRGTTLTKMDSSGVWHAVRSFPATITDIEPFPNSTAASDDLLLIALGTSDEYWYMTTGEVFTESNATDKTYQFFKTVHTTTPTVYGNDGTYTLRSTDDPANSGTAWSAQTIVDSSYHAITGLIQKSGALYIPKEDMPYYLDSSGNVQNDLAPELVTETSSTSGKNTTVYKNNIYYQAGDQTLLEIGTSNTFLNPASYCTDLTVYNGSIQAIAFDSQWLFIAVDYSTKVEILCGRYETIDGSTSWVWHPYQEITLAGCETMFVSSVYQKRLYIASTSSSDSLYYIPLPTGYGNVASDTNRSFATTGTYYFTTPWYHGRFKAHSKTFYSITVDLGHPYDVDIYYECWYQKWGDSSWTDAGDLKGSATSMSASLTIPVDGSGNKPTSTMMRFKFVAKTDSSTKTPIMNNYTIRSVLYPDVREVIECTVRCGNEILDREGSKLDLTAADIRAVLNEARDSTYPVTLYDYFGNVDNEGTVSSKTVKLLPIEPFEYPVMDSESEFVETAFKLRMMVM